MKKISLLVVALLLGGCASSNQSRTFYQFILSGLDTNMTTEVLVDKAGATESSKAENSTDGKISLTDGVL